MDTQQPQMETPVTNRVVFLRSGVFQFVRYVGVPMQQAAQWAHSQLRDMATPKDGHVYAAVIQAGYYFEDPYNRDAEPRFIPTNKKRGILLDETVLNDPLVSMREIFALDGSVFL